jgi:hypothetical protein
VYVINNACSFTYFLRKQGLQHAFKYLRRRSRSLLVLVDTHSRRIRNEPWLDGSATTVEVPSNSLSCLLETLIASVSHTQEAGVRWQIPRALALYFLSRLGPKASLGVLPRIRLFLREKGGRFEEGRQLGVTRDILEEFQQRCFNLAHGVSLCQLSIHEQLVVVAAHGLLAAREELALATADLFERYRWACDSSSLQARSLKSFRAELVAQLETYNVMRAIRAKGCKKGEHLFLTLSLPSI